MLTIHSVTQKLRILTLSALLAAPILADSLTVVTSPAAQAATDSINWSSVGKDQALLNASGSVKSTKGASVVIAMAGANSVLSVACSASPCSWTSGGFTAGHTLLWTSDAGNGGNGPVTLTFPAGLSGVGAYLEADGPGAFTASLQAFHGSTPLGTVSLPSNSNGSALYLGVHDGSGPNITSVTFSLSKVSQGLVTDFALDTIEMSSGSTSAPVVSFSPSSVSFGNQPVWSTSAAHPITLKNTGSASLVISKWSVAGDFSEANNCPSTLAAGASCTVNATFHPSATGTRSGSITLSDNASGGSQVVPLTGVGTASGTLSVSSSKLTFAAQLIGTASAAQTLNLTNSGSATLYFKSIVSTGDFAQSHTCGASLASKASCSIAVTFRPTAAGTRTGTIAVTDSGSSTVQTIALSGTGTAVKVSSAKLTFPATKVGTVSAAQSVTVTNVGPTTLSFSSIAITGTDAADFSQSNTCGSGIAKGASCTITTKFQPKVKGTLSATLAITDNGGASPQIASLNGIGN